VCAAKYGRLARLVPSEILFFIQNLEPRYLQGARGQQDRGMNFTDRRSRAVLGGQEVYAAYFAGAGSAPKSEAFIGQGYSNRTATGTATGDEPQTIFAVLSGKTFNGGCCFDYGNAERTQNCHPPPPPAPKMGQRIDGGHLLGVRRPLAAVEV
jgi:hypothetical protein